MATWILSTDQPDTYWQVGNVSRVTIGERFDDGGASLGWWILALVIGTNGLTPLKGPYASDTQARTALTNGIASLGGAI